MPDDYSVDVLVKQVKEAFTPESLRQMLQMCENSRGARAGIIPAKGRAFQFIQKFWGGDQKIVDVRRK